MRLSTPALAVISALACVTVDKSRAEADTPSMKASAGAQPATPRSERMTLLLADAKMTAAATPASSTASAPAKKDSAIVELSPYIVRETKRALKVEPTESKLARFQRTGTFFESANKRSALMFEALPNGGGGIAFHLRW